MKLSSTSGLGLLCLLTSMAQAAWIEERTGKKADPQADTQINIDAAVEETLYSLRSYGAYTPNTRTPVDKTTGRVTRAYGNNQWYRKDDKP